MAIIFTTSFLLILYHHIGYPLLLNLFAKRRTAIEPGTTLPLNKFIFVIPMYNEAKYISKKISNLAQISYPRHQFEVWLLNDGSTDKTLTLAKAAEKKYPELTIKIRSSMVNRGKVAWFNQMIPEIPDECIVFFSDVSASLPHDVLDKTNQYFNNPHVGAYCTRYTLQKKDLAGEQYYWRYQNNIKIQESRLGSPIGYHGTGYAIRKSLWKKLPANTINDDFVLPLQAIEQICPVPYPSDNNEPSDLTADKKTSGGYLGKWLRSIKRIWCYKGLRRAFWGVYDPTCISVENEPLSQQSTFHRRTRIAAGNIQQVFILFRLLAPRQGFVAWMFFSGKVLRIFMPWFMILLFLSTIFLAKQGSLFFFLCLLGQIICYLSIISNYLIKTSVTDVTSHFVQGHLAMLAGWFYFFKLNKTGLWKRSNTHVKHSYCHPIVRVGKCCIDKFFALIGLLILICVTPLFALIIKISSPGPVFYKQLRVGLGTEIKTSFFYLYKFRTMKVNSEFTGARWVGKNDRRVFWFGNFMRNTHLDELPQVINILKGDMSLIGPRPERLDLYPYIVKHIPYYQERLFEVRPGLTGLSQVTYGHDRTIKHVKSKVALDHSYAIYLTKPWIWFTTDMNILFKTIAMILLRQDP